MLDVVISSSIIIIIIIVIIIIIIIIIKHLFCKQELISIRVQDFVTCENFSLNCAITKSNFAFFFFLSAKLSFFSFNECHNKE